MSGIVIYGFLIGTGVFLDLQPLHCTYDSKPLSDMRKSMVIADGKLQANDRHYSNSDINELNIHYNALVEKNNRLIEQVFEKRTFADQGGNHRASVPGQPSFHHQCPESVY